MSTPKVKPGPNWEPSPELVAQVQAAWAKLAPQIDGLMHRMASPDGFDVDPGSELAADDVASSPYQVSHAARSCLAAAVDHLHASKVLAHDSGLLHLAAPATLARGTIETASTGLWILSPDSRQERVRRTLMWHAQNIHDHFRSGLAPKSSTKSERLARLEVVADRFGLSAKSYKSADSLTQILQTVEAEHPDLSSLLMSWRICSGFAHGRPWVYLGALQQEVVAKPEPGVFDIKLTNDSSLALFHILTAALVTERLLKRRQELASPPRAGAAPASFTRP